MTDRRVWFFVVAALMSFALYPPAPEAFRWVTLALGGVYLLLALLTVLDGWSRDHDGGP